VANSFCVFLQLKKLARNVVTNSTLSQIFQIMMSFYGVSCNVLNCRRAVKVEDGNLFKPENTISYKTTLSAYVYKKYSYVLKLSITLYTSYKGFN
jgi:uncharacterized protein with ParB-like and HNH nuclease domain